MSTRDVLVKARELISDPKRWTKNTSARDAEGQIIGAQDSDAVCWCAIGAVRRVIGPEPSAYEAHQVLEEVMPDGIVRFNDDPTTTHRDVLAAFDIAICLVS